MSDLPPIDVPSLPVSSGDDDSGAEGLVVVDPKDARRTGNPTLMQDEWVMQQVWELRCKGLNAVKIGKVLDLKPERVRQMLASAQVYAAADIEETAREAVLLQVAQYDAIVEKWSEAAHDPMHPNGTAAAAVVIRCLENKAKLLGLKDVPMGRQQQAFDLRVALQSAEMRAALRAALDEADAGVQQQQQEAGAPVVEGAGLRAGQDGLPSS